MPLTQRHAMFAVLPFGVPIAKLLEAPRVKTSGQSQLAEPFDDRHIDAARGGIPNDKAYFRRRCANPPERLPCRRHVPEPASGQVVVALRGTTLRSEGR